MAEQVQFPQWYQGGSGLGPPICPPDLSRRSLGEDGWRCQGRDRFPNGPREWPANVGSFRFIHSQLIRSDASETRPCHSYGCGSASVRPFVRRTCPGVALAKTDGGAKAGTVFRTVRENGGECRVVPAHSFSAHSLGRVGNASCHLRLRLGLGRPLGEDGWRCQAGPFSERSARMGGECRSFRFIHSRLIRSDASETRPCQSYGCGSALVRPLVRRTDGGCE